MAGPSGACGEAGLLERFNLTERLLALCLLPERQKFTLVDACPFDDEAQRARRKVPAEHDQAADVDQHFLVAIEGIKFGGL